MRKIRELLRLKHLGRSQRQIASSLCVAVGGDVSVKVASGIFVDAVPLRTHLLQSLSEPDDALHWAQGSEDNDTSGLQE